MPANIKYLTASKWQRFAKISASTLGGFLVTSALHLAIAVFMQDKKIIWATYSFSLFVLWCPLMLLPFLFENGWKCWLLYGIAFILFNTIFATGVYLQIPAGQ